LGAQTVGRSTHVRQNQETNEFEGEERDKRDQSYGVQKSTDAAKGPISLVVPKPFDAPRGGLGGGDFKKDRRKIIINLQLGGGTKNRVT